MNAFFALVQKDLVLYFSNRRALVTTILAPIAIAAFFGFLFDTSPKETSKIQVAMTDLDQSVLSKKIVAAFAADTALEVHNIDAAAGRDLVQHGKARAAIVLPSGFGPAATRALFGGPKPEVTIDYDPSQAMILPMVRGMLAEHVMGAVGQTVFSGNGEFGIPAQRNLLERNPDISPERRAALKQLYDSVERFQNMAPAANAAGAQAGVNTPASTGGGMQIPFDTKTVEATSGNHTKYNSFAHSFAGMGVQFVLFMGIEIGVGLLLARRLGLWKRLRAAPVSRGLLLGSRVASGALTAFILLMVIYAAAIAFFGVRIEGSILGFIGVAATFSILTSTFGLLIAALGKTPEATRGLAVFATLLMVMLGGAWVPTFIFPPWLEKISSLVPTRWAVDGLDAMTWRGLGLSDAAFPILVMLAFSAVFAAIALARFDWEE